MNIKAYLLGNPEAGFHTYPENSSLNAYNSQFAKEDTFYIQKLSDKISYTYVKYGIFTAHGATGREGSNFGICIELTDVGFKQSSINQILKKLQNYVNDIVNAPNFLLEKKGIVIAFSVKKLNTNESRVDKLLENIATSIKSEFANETEKLTSFPEKVEIATISTQIPITADPITPTPITNFDKSVSIFYKQVKRLEQEIADANPTTLIELLRKLKDSAKNISDNVKILAKLTANNSEYKTIFDTVTSIDKKIDNLITELSSSNYLYNKSIQSDLENIQNTFSQINIKLNQPKPINKGFRWAALFLSFMFGMVLTIGLAYFFLLPPEAKPIKADATKYTLIAKGADEYCTLKAKEFIASCKEHKDKVQNTDDLKKSLWKRLENAKTTNNKPIWQSYIDFDTSVTNLNPEGFGKELLANTIQADNSTWTHKNWENDENSGLKNFRLYTKNKYLEIAPVVAVVDTTKKLSPKEQANYDAAIKAANTAMSNRKYQVAITKYNDALKIKLNDDVAMQGLDKVVATITLAGDDAMAKNNFAKAITMFDLALTVKKNDAVLNQRLIDAAAKELAQKEQNKPEQKLPTYKVQQGDGWEAIAKVQCPDCEDIPKYGKEIAAKNRNCSLVAEVTIIQIPLPSKAAKKKETKVNNDNDAKVAQKASLEKTMKAAKEKLDTASTPEIKAKLQSDFDNAKKAFDDLK